MKKFALIFLSISIFSGCKSPEEIFPKPDQETIRRANLSGTITTNPMKKMPGLSDSGIKKIGVVIVHDNEVKFHKVGLTMFNNEEYYKAEPSLFNYEEIYNYIKEVFGEYTDIEIVPMPEFMQKVQEARKRLGSYWNPPDRLGLKDPLPEVIEKCKENDLDAVLLISETIHIKDFIKNLRLPFDSRGLYSRFDQNWIYSVFTVSLYDGKDLSAIKKRQYIQGSAIPIPEIPWRTAYELYTEEEIEIIKNRMREVYLMALEEVLRAYNEI